ncbi:MAG: WYL domain-containing protein [Ruminococcus sp.]|nr:WYL domain-containing protein [Ruminococcus sp.]
MSSFSELIKNFDKTRDYLRDFFVYGFKVRTDFDRKSSRTYDDEKRRAESWLDGCFRYISTARGKQAAITLDSGRIYENPLYKAYYSKSFTDNDIKLHFMITDILQDFPEGLCARRVTEQLLDRYGEFFDEQTVRLKLKEYAAEGIYNVSRQGKKDFFTLSPHTPERLFREFPGLANAVRFFSQSSEFGVVGNSILRAADLENNIFLNKHNYIVHTLEDEILLALTDNISRKHRVKISGFGKRGGSSEHSGVPLKIYVSGSTGRRYLIMYSPDVNRFSSFRLDHIKKVADLGECPDFDKHAADLEKNKDKVFGVSFGGNRSSGGRVKIVFFADEKREQYIIDRLEREKRSGSIEKMGENLFTFTGEFFDTNEMMSWLKSFTGRIVSVDGPGDYAEKRFLSDIKRMNEMYNKGSENQ